ncbi:hypothetical protein CK203_106348 [Vitis vinifera]|uniref:Uncharacterized protein n=1 Tax=Vitis vinifera TaxID=29760 RepID=A0A438BNN2_VITVI|nr:hypothetical protein CK203_106348 [Vitis vinifera]
MTHHLLQKSSPPPCEAIPRHFTPCGHQEEEGTSASCPYQLWCSSEGAIQTRPHLARLVQVPLFLRIHLRPLRPRPFHLLRVGCPLALLNADTRHRDSQLLRPQSHQYTAFHQRQLGPQAPKRHLGMRSLIPRA